MKRIGILLFILFACLIAAPMRLAAQPHYTVTDLGTLGGTFSLPYAGINDKGTVAGFATLTGDTETHGFLWKKGKMIDIGTLGGPNSWAWYGHNEKAQLTGQAETLTSDSSGGCGDGLNLACAPMIWRKGVMTQLPTLGGPNGWSGYMNESGQIVGSVQNTNPNACVGFDYKPVLWEHGQIKELPTLPGDIMGGVLTINDKGQAVGQTGPDICGMMLNAVLWQNDTVTYLGSLGGTFNIAAKINNRGQIAGFSSLPNETEVHAVLWEQNREMKDLGTLTGDVFARAIAINNEGQVVGHSCAAYFFNCRAFLWQDNSMTDLNTRIPPSSPWFLMEGDGINARGEIVAGAFNSETGESHAVLLTPKKCAEDAECDAFNSHTARPTFILPEHVRQMLRQRMTAGHMGIRSWLPQ